MRNIDWSSIIAGAIAGAVTVILGIWGASLTFERRITTLEVRTEYMEKQVATLMGLPTATPSPTATSTPTTTPNRTPTPFFSDDFNGDSIDPNLWNMETANLVVQDGHLYVPPLENKNTDYADLRIETDAHFPALSEIEFRAAVLDGRGIGWLSILTGCLDEPIDSSLEVQLIFGDFVIEGAWRIQDQRGDIKWNHPLELGRTYNIRLVQDGDVVRAYVDNMEMPEPYPCTSMGHWLAMSGATFRDGFIEGYFDYIRAWRAR